MVLNDTNGSFLITSLCPSFPTLICFQRLFASFCIAPERVPYVLKRLCVTQDVYNGQWLVMSYESKILSPITRLFVLQDYPLPTFMSISLIQNRFHNQSRSAVVANPTLYLCNTILSGHFRTQSPRLWSQHQREFGFSLGLLR